MATIVLGAVGAAVGGSLGGSVLGVSAAVIGRAAGATIGRLVDQKVLGAGSDPVEHGKIDRFRLTGASEGAPIARVFGRVRVPGQIIWATRFKEHRSVSGGGGKGAPSAPQTTSYSYSVSFAVALCEGEITRVGRIWADGTEVARSAFDMRVYHGTEDQLPDALIQSVEGAEASPAYKGIAYVVIEDLDLAPFGNRLPQLSFEIVRPSRVDGLQPSPAETVQGVAIVPGTGEYALATTGVHYAHGGGVKDSANVNTIQEEADFKVSLRALEEELPNLKAASLVVSWFGNDLRCSDCVIEPAIEQADVDGTPQPWTVSGLTRTTARVVPVSDGRPVYGGTPGDHSVVEAIKAMNDMGIDVTFYPFILMDQQAGNGLPDPWGNDEQAVLPWRGRITTSLGPDQAGSPDRSAAAELEVSAFFGTAQASDFVVGNGVVTYTGPNEWSYRRFILHYAALCAAAGGVEAFCIGSEMRGLTQIRGAGDSFPAVAQLVALAGEVRQLLPDAKLSYAADWTEYFGYHPQDTGNVHFHLDPLWASTDIDFIGIDNYMPLSDWRGEEGEADGDYGAVYNPQYLSDNIEGGEGYDWYYSSPEARTAQRRSPITDGAYDEPWIFRFKDLTNWWSNAHHDRIDGVRVESSTAFVPSSKPIRFTEYGCAAVDKGTNQPNKFLDPKSSESSLPRYSTGRRDDTIQMQYLRALTAYWDDNANNPASQAYDGRMIDMAHSFAWAWDARPWPAFPDLREFWTDGENHPRGHWLSGRTGQQPLANVIAEICESSGITSYDVDEVYGVVRGYTINDSHTARSDLQPLLVAHGVEVVERDGKLVFFMRENAKAHSLDPERLARGNGPIVGIQRAPDAEIAHHVRVHHQDAEGAFEARTSAVVQSDDAPLPVADWEIPLSLTSSEGHGLAERFLAESHIARDSIEFALPPSMQRVGPGDIVSMDGTGDTWRIDRLEDGLDRKAQAVRTELHVHEPSDAVEDGQGRLRPAVALPVDAVFLDLPLLTGDEVPHQPQLAISARPWTGTVAVHSSVEDAGYTLNSLINGPSIIGLTETELPPARHGIIDNGPDLVVRLNGGDLSSVSAEALYSGANAIAIGDGSASGWEIFQFQNATLVGPDRWALSGRLRGQRGTDALISGTRPIGSIVVLLDGSTTQVTIAPDALGLARHFRIGPASLPLDHESYQHFEETFFGEGLRPYAPAHLRGDRTNAGLSLRWVRRSRLPFEGWSAGDVPLGETTEAYRVALFAETGALVSEKVVSEPNATFTAAELDAAGLATGGLTASVQQISDVYGPGHAADVHVS